MFQFGRRRSKERLYRTPREGQTLTSQSGAPPRACWSNHQANPRCSLIPRRVKKHHRQPDLCMPPRRKVIFYGLATVTPRLRALVPVERVLALSKRVLPIRPGDARSRGRDVIWLSLGVRLNRVLFPNLRRLRSLHQPHFPLRLSQSHKDHGLACRCRRPTTRCRPASS